MGGSAALGILASAPQGGLGRRLWSTGTGGTRVSGRRAVVEVTFEPAGLVARPNLSRAPWRSAAAQVGINSQRQQLNQVQHAHSRPPTAQA